MSTYTWLGKTYTLPPFDLQKYIAGGIATRKAKGMFLEVFPDEVCPHCHTAVASIPARCWGYAVAGFSMSGLDTHRCGASRQQQEVAVYVPPKELVYTEHVILLQGAPVFITGKELDLYFEKCMSKKFPFFIRRAVIDKVYPTIPYQDWADSETRRGRDVSNTRTL